MTAGLRSALVARLGCDVRAGEPLARHTTYRIGGPADAMVFPRTPEDVGTALQVAAESGAPWLVLGLGSNVLVADQGFRGVVIRIGKGLDRVTREGPEGSRWIVGAGLPTPLLARQSAAAGHAGLQRLIGVPGTVGGGVFMNAGAHGQDFSLVTRAVDVVDPSGGRRVVPAETIAWRYRASGLAAGVVVGVTLDLVPGDPTRTQADLALYLRKRKEGTPFDAPCCGSVFRNPEVGVGDGLRTAGQLIDAAGLKGYRVGGAEVSRQHANYIVNTGTATAADVRAVMSTVQGRVRERFGVTLEPEVQLIGFDGRV